MVIFIYRREPSRSFLFIEIFTCFSVIIIRLRDPYFKADVLGIVFKGFHFVVSSLDKYLVTYMMHIY